QDGRTAGCTGSAFLVFGREVERIVLALFRAFSQFHAAFGPCLRRRGGQLLRRRPVLAPERGDGQRLPGRRPEVAAVAARRNGERGQRDQGKGADRLHARVPQSSPSASRASATRFLTSLGAVPPWLARAATLASTESAA